MGKGTLTLPLGGTGMLLSSCTTQLYILCRRRYAGCGRTRAVAGGPSLCGLIDRLGVNRQIVGLVSACWGCFWWRPAQPLRIAMPSSQGVWVLMVVSIYAPDLATGGRLLRLRGGVEIPLKWTGWRVVCLRSRGGGCQNPVQTMSSPNSRRFKSA